MRWACLLLCVSATVLGAVRVGSVAAQPTDGTPHFWPADAAPGTSGPTPEELAGFHFGDSPSAAERRCRRAGHRFEELGDGTARCGGAAAPRGLRASVFLVFCPDGLCEARATVGDDSRVRTYAQALRSLRGAFGAPPQRRLRVDHRCLGELVSGRGDSCLDQVGAGVRHWWEVGGTEIFLSLEHREEGRVLEVAYRNRERMSALSRTSD